MVVSFFASAVKDANGTYVFDDDTSTYSLELDIETVLDKAGDADVWLQAGSVQGSLNDLAKADERFMRRFQAIVEKHDKNLYGAQGGGQG